MTGWIEKVVEDAVRLRAQRLDDDLLNVMDLHSQIVTTTRGQLVRGLPLLAPHLRSNPLQELTMVAPTALEELLGPDLAELGIVPIWVPNLGPYLYLFATGAFAINEADEAVYLGGRSYKVWVDVDIAWPSPAEVVP